MSSDADAGVTPSELSEQVAAAVLSVPGVHDLHGGVLGEVATYLPGRRVNGIRLLDGANASMRAVGPASSLSMTFLALPLCVP